jgi:hypothetical protein
LAGYNLEATQARLRCHNNNEELLLLLSHRQVRQGLHQRDPVEDQL